MPSNDAPEVATPNQVVTDWNAIPPLRYLIHRVGRGANPTTRRPELWVDPAFVTNVAEMRSRYEFRGGYWRLFSWIPGIDQAEAFLNAWTATGGVQRGDLPEGDVENGVALGDTSLLPERLVLDFFDTVDTAIGRKAAIYLNDDERSKEGRLFWQIDELMAGRFWRCPGYSAQPPVPYHAWQWNNQGVCPGITGRVLWNEVRDWDALARAAGTGTTMTYLEWLRKWDIIPREAWLKESWIGGSPSFPASSIRVMREHYPGGTNNGLWDPSSVFEEAYLNAMQRDYRVNRGYDLGYGFVKFFSGRIYEARGLRVQSASDGNQTVNSQAVSCQAAVPTTTVDLNDAMVNVDRRLFAAVEEWLGRRLERWEGHRDAIPGATVCPGDTIYFSRIRDQATGAWKNVLEPQDTPPPSPTEKDEDVTVLMVNSQPYPQFEPAKTLGYVPPDGPNGQWPVGWIWFELVPPHVCVVNHSAGVYSGGGKLWVPGGEYFNALFELSKSGQSVVIEQRTTGQLQGITDYKPLTTTTTTATVDLNTEVNQQAIIKAVDRLLSDETIVSNEGSLIGLKAFFKRS